MNTFGNIYRLTSFGESHGPAVGGVIDGLPAGVILDLGQVQDELNRRRPGQSTLVSSRNEADCVRFLSGLMAYDSETEGIYPLLPDTKIAIALGTPIGFMVENRGMQSRDYEPLKNLFRPSHADFAWDARYCIRDWRGGGRASGRETIARVVSGAIARQLLVARGVTVESRISQIGSICNPTTEQIAQTVSEVKANADSVGGVIECTVSGLPAGIGEPTFGKLQQLLASAMLSIGAVKGFDYGMGFNGVGACGSEVADEIFKLDDGTVFTATNHSGGIQGGISNGMDINFRVAVKPTPSIAKPLHTIDSSGNKAIVETHGRHDPSILLRIPVVVEAMASMVILDAMLMRSVSW